jgi:hypothetical protein
VLSGLALKNRNNSTAPTLHVIKRTENLQVLNTTIERTPATPAGNSAIYIAEHSDARPTDVLLSGVTVRQASPDPLVHAVSLASLTIKNAQLIYTGPATTRPAVLVQGLSQIVQSVLIMDTVISGALGGAATITGMSAGPPVLIRVTGP